MSFWKLFSAPVNKIVDSVGDAIDKNVTNEEEKLVLRNELQKTILSAEIEFEKLELERVKEISQRHKTDMTSDSWLSKNIRPMAFIFMLAMTTLFTFSDGNLHWNDWAFTVKEGWVELWTALTITFAVFYAGGRSFEKTAKIKAGKEI